VHFLTVEGDGLGRLHQHNIVAKVCRQDDAIICFTAAMDDKLDDAAIGFHDVAHLIAGDDAKEWLVDGLMDCGQLVDVEPRTAEASRWYDAKLTEVHDAVRCLIELLPLFLAGPIKFRTNDVTTVLDALPRIEEVLAKALTPIDGRPNMPRRICAQVVVEAWRIVHGHVSARSPKVYAACDAYWRACGGDYRGSDVGRLAARRAGSAAQSRRPSTC
jgi:hypothetical protein